MSITVSRIKGRTLCDRERNYKVKTSLKAGMVIDTFRGYDRECAVAFEKWVKKLRSIERGGKPLCFKKRVRDLIHTDLPDGVYDRVNPIGYTNLAVSYVIIIPVEIESESKRIFSRTYGKTAACKSNRSRCDAIRLCVSAVNEWIRENGVESEIALFKMVE